MLRFASLASGSSGNCLVVEAGVGASATRVLLDCGLNLTDTERRLARLGLAPSQIDGMLITHEHGDHAHGVFDFASWDPKPAGSHPAGRSAWGVDDLVGNGWEWTRTVFEPFPGFVPIPSYPEYSADFFDGEHFVMKGASPATARELLRPTFRNWFRPRYPYVYATFRCAISR